MKKSYLLGLLASALAFTANANIIPTLSGITPSGSAFTWNYTANVTTDQTVVTGNYFTIYDFSSISPTVVTAPAGWAYTTALVGVTPSDQLPVDSASLFNVTFTYTGTAIVGPSSLGTFSINSNTDQLRSGYFSGNGTRSSGPFAGTAINNTGILAVPVPEMSALAPLVGVCGIGAIGMVSSLLRRRQKQG